MFLWVDNAVDKSSRPLGMTKKAYGLVSGNLLNTLSTEEVEENKKKKKKKV